MCGGGSGVTIHVAKTSTDQLISYRYCAADLRHFVFIYKKACFLINAENPIYDIFNDR